MNKDIMRALGFDKEVELVDMGYCPFCEEPIDPESFNDVLSLKEWKISGLCQSCQNEIFREREEDR